MKRYDVVILGSVIVVAGGLMLLADKPAPAQVSGQPYQGAVGPVPNFSIGTVTSVPYGSAPSIVIAGTPYNPIMNVQMETGQTGNTGSSGAAGGVGPTGPTGPSGAAALNFGARAQTDTTGLYVWTFPTGCKNAGNIPYFSAVAEGPSPQSGVTVNPQVEGVPTATTVSFRVTRVTATTVSLIGLTILSVTAASATFLDLTCAPQ